MTRPRKELDLEDRILWSKVAETARPLPGKAVPVPEVAVERVQAPTEEPGPGGVRNPPPPPRPGVPPVHPIDRTTHRKLAKGRIAIEASVDLHGLSQGDAHAFLHDFLRRAHARGIRYVLVITGKGTSSGGVGVLRRAVPEWLVTPAFRVFVSGYEDAARGHGGTGALYVRLRRTVRSEGGAG
jgi:DNA-nicking Smr family endonuclease